MSILTGIYLASEGCYKGDMHRSREGSIFSGKLQVEV